MEDERLVSNWVVIGYLVYVREGNRSYLRPSKKRFAVRRVQRQRSAAVGERVQQLTCTGVDSRCQRELN